MRHAVLAIALAAALGAQSAELDRFHVDAERYLSHVRTLSSDELGGRGNGTPGLARAAEYIAAEFKKAGLQPGGNGGSYLQAFDLPQRASPKDKAVKPTVANVVGVLGGSDPSLAGEAIVIGAHYDHLGSDARFSSLRGSGGQIHNGADDNASGTALVIEMAHAAAAAPAQFKRSLVFVAFAAEEIGLLGSKHYVDHPPISIAKTVAMINLDMVGRANGRVLIGGLERRPAFQQIVAELRPLTRLRLDDFREGYGDDASDHHSFERARVPSLMLFTGFHDDYHTPRDDWDRIDASGAAEIARLALAIAAKLGG